MSPIAAYRPVLVCSALADDMRWDILQRIGASPASASELARELPVSRQAIARHLSVLADVGLVEIIPDGRQLRYRALGGPLTQLAADLDVIARAWEQRLDRLAAIAESRAREARGARRTRDTREAADDPRGGVRS